MDTIREFLVSVALPAMGTVLLVALFSVAKQYAAKIKDERLRRLVEALVMAAEQIYGAGKGAEKKAYVQAALPKNVPDALIEATVYDQLYYWRKESSANGFIPEADCGEGGGVPEAV